MRYRRRTPECCQQLQALKWQVFISQRCFHQSQGKSFHVNFHFMCSSEPETWQCFFIFIEADFHLSVFCLVLLVKLFSFLHSSCPRSSVFCPLVSSRLSLITNVRVCRLPVVIISPFPTLVLARAWFKMLIGLLQI